ncbi:hypothetical protein NDU88_008282 [Pleurodeles waltl]|uniref:Uncharacterized protein n=1 Tax=Pleurodeles waltl TaxID=8319 RepID=A0AAV7VV27_PLEWA|nr:hypothetical protein NDU88_008282 [Pleurodeles waltl]
MMQHPQTEDRRESQEKNQSSFNLQTQQMPLLNKRRKMGSQEVHVEKKKIKTTVGGLINDCGLMLLHSVRSRKKEGGWTLDNIGSVKQGVILGTDLAV